MKNRSIMFSYTSAAVTAIAKGTPELVRLVGVELKPHERVAAV